MGGRGSTGLFLDLNGLTFGKDASRTSVRCRVRLDDIDDKENEGDVLKQLRQGLAIRPGKAQGFHPETPKP